MTIEQVDIPYYYRSVNWDELVREYPPAPGFFRTTFLASPEEIAALQGRRWREAVKRAAEVPFYQRLWHRAGLTVEQALAARDLRSLPTYSVDQIRESMEAAPPFGDYAGVDVRAGHLPLRIHSSGGTTGVPRPTFYGPWDREVGNILRARSYYLHGLRPGDFVMNTALYATHNAAFTIHEALWNWMGCVPITTSAGIVTRTRRALEIARDWGATAIIGYPEYLVHMAQEAADMGLDVGKGLRIRQLDTFGKSAEVSAAWKLPAFDTYGTHEVQAIASECPVGGGLHVWEDAFVPEVVDPESGKAIPDGQPGALVITALYKRVYPVVRYNLRDVTRMAPRAVCACGSWMRKIDPIMGRADLMIKLRGINVWPEACGALIAKDPRMNGEYYCVVERQGARDEMTVLAEHRGGMQDIARIKVDLEGLLRERLQVAITVEPVAPGELAARTGLQTAPKPKRLEDRRDSKLA